MGKIVVAGAVLCLLALNASSASAQQSDPEKAKNIRRLLELTRAIETGLNAIKQGITSTRKATPQLPERFWQEFESEATKDFRSESFLNEMAAIYDRNMTGEEIKGLVAFYETPLGQKVINVLPQIVSEANTVGERHGREIGLRVAEKLRAEGVPPFGGPQIIPPPVKPVKP